MRCLSEGHGQELASTTGDVHIDDFSQKEYDLNTPMTTYSWVFIFMGLSIIRSIKEPLDIPEKLFTTLTNDGVDCNISYVEELAFSNFNYEGSHLKETVYFFNNAKSASVVAHLLRHNGREVINGRYLERNITKEYAQLLLLENGYKIPSNYFSPELASLSRLKEQIRFPLLLKSFRHAEKIIQLNSYTEYMNLTFQGEVIQPVYAEEFLTSGYRSFKAYGINGVAYFDSFGESVKSEKLKDDIKKIGGIFSLDAYSIDCIFNQQDKTVFIIDVNPSPAFGGSKEAEQYFIKYLKSKSEKQKQ